MIRIVLFTLGLCFLSSAATAQLNLKSKYDFDNNGEISETEYLHYHTERFVKADKNYDNKLTHAELEAFRALENQEFLKKQFLKWDINKNGEVTFSEYLEEYNDIMKGVVEDNMDPHDATFDKMDVDKNGHVSRSEYKDYMDALMTQLMEDQEQHHKTAFDMMDKDNDGVVGEDEYLGKSPSASVQSSEVKSDPKNKPVKRDANDDGDITRSEDQAYHLDQFKGYDENSDGVITRKEAMYLFLEF